MAAFLTLLGLGVLAVTILKAVFMFLILSIGYFQLFRKAGLPGWCAFIPYLQDYCILKISWTTNVFLLIPILDIAHWFITWKSPESFLLTLLGFVILAFRFLINYYLSKSFGYGLICAIFMTVWPFLTVLILGFMSSVQYVGNTYTRRE